MDKSRALLFERYVIAAFSAFYLIVFHTNIPSGDALVYVRQIEEGLLVWNPNHLLMQPVGKLFYDSIGAAGAGLSILNTFKLISAVSAIASLYLFHLILVQVNVQSSLLRVFGVLGLFASNYFLTMSVTEEYFMLQMPFLLIALMMLIKWAESRTSEGKYLELVISGAMLSIASLVIVNNVFLMAFMGLYVLTAKAAGRSERVRALFAFSVSVCVVFIPVILFGFYLSEYDGRFVEWMSSYQGEDSNPLSNLYGVDWTVIGVVNSIARLGFNFFANFIDLGGIGTVLQSWVFGQELEFRPDMFQVVQGTILFAVLLIASSYIAFWISLRLRKHQILQIIVVWIIAYLAFNFLWNDSSDQFWFQILPALWLAIMLYLNENKARNKCKKCDVILTIFVSFVLIQNTMQAIVPKAFIDTEALSQRHKVLIEGYAVEIIPGWDGIRWLGLKKEITGIEQVTLMDISLSGDGAESLTDKIDGYLEQGGRVIVARLYDLDENPRPWVQLKKLGMSRKQIKKTLEKYDHRKVGSINGVVFYELVKVSQMRGQKDE